MMTHIAVRHDKIGELHRGAPQRADEISVQIIPCNKAKLYHAPRGFPRLHEAFLCYLTFPSGR